MKQITTSKGTFIFVEVPNDAKGVNVFKTDLNYRHSQNKQSFVIDHVTLPDGNYQLICTTKNATEEQASMFGICAITKDGTLYKYGVVANDGLPAAQGGKGWVWSEFELTLQGAINKFLKQNKLARKNNYAILKQI